MKVLEVHTDSGVQTFWVKNGTELVPKGSVAITKLVFRDTRPKKHKDFTEQLRERFNYGQKK